MKMPWFLNTAFFNFGISETAVILQDKRSDPLFSKLKYLFA
jgi:hypothetical protein